MPKTKNPVDTYYYSGPFKVGDFENYLSKFSIHVCVFRNNFYLQYLCMIKNDVNYGICEYFVFFSFYLHLELLR